MADMVGGTPQRRVFQDLGGHGRPHALDPEVYCNTQQVKVWAEIWDTLDEQTTTRTRDVWNTTLKVISKTPQCTGGRS